MAFYDTLGPMISGWVTTVMFWVIIIALMAVVIPVTLYFRKKRALDKPVLELFDIGTSSYNPDGSIDFENSVGVFDFKLTKGGWFKTHSTFFGLIDYGHEKIFKLADGTPIYDVSHNDYRKINGVNGLIVLRNPHDPKFAIPLSRFLLSENSKRAIAEIAPVDLRNAATAAIEQVDVEMQTKWEKWAPLITMSIIALVLIFSILLIAQYGKHNIDVTSETLKYAADRLAGGPSYVPSTTAP